MKLENCAIVYKNYLKILTFVHFNFVLFPIFYPVFIESTFAQPYIGGAYDIGEGRHGERRGKQ